MIGPELANAMFGVLFHEWNQKRRKESDASQSEGVSERFGLGGSLAQSAGLEDYANIVVSRKMQHLSHFLVNKYLVLRYLVNVSNVPNIVQLIGRSATTTRLLNDLSKSHVLIGNSDQCQNFGFQIEGVPASFEDICSKEIAKLCHLNQPYCKHLVNKGFSADQSENLKIMNSLEVKCLKDLVNTISVPIVIFTKSKEVPVIPFFPSESSLALRNVFIFLSYSCGKYTSLCSIEATKEPRSKKSKGGCGCGRSNKKGEDAMSCVDSFYKSRCPWLCWMSVCWVL